MHLSKEECIKINNQIHNDYKDKIQFTYTSDINEPGGAFFFIKKIILNERFKKNPTEWTLITTLHEIGHILTNKITQRRCVREYLATQWAFDQCNHYGIPISNRNYNLYQEYIFGFLEKSLVRCFGVKKEDLVLKR